MRHVLSFIGGFIVARVAIIVVLIVVGLLIAGAQAPEHTPVPAQQAVEARHRQEVLSQDYEEEQRQREYAATPGPGK